MLGKWFSGSGKNASEDKMTSLALSEAKGWADALMNREFRGRGDKEKSARYRLAKNTGIPESYLFRLQYKTAEMKDVAGSVYRALMIAYDKACVANEEAAERYRAARLGINHEETNQEPVSTGARMAVPAVGKAEAEEA